jgi:hypothetical protein
VDLPGGGDDEAVAAAEGGGPRGGEAGAQRRHVMCLPAYSTNGDGDACLYEQLCLGEPQRRLGASTIDLVWWGLRACPKQKRRGGAESPVVRYPLGCENREPPGHRNLRRPPCVRRMFGGILFFLFGIGWWRLRPMTAVTSSFTRPSLAVAAWMRASARAACPVPRTRHRRPIRKMDRHSIWIFAVASDAFLIFVHPLESDGPHMRSRFQDTAIWSILQF